MSKRAHPDASDVVARARAAIAEKYAKLNSDHKSPKSSSASEQPKVQPVHTVQDDNATRSPIPSGALHVDIQRRIDEAKLRAAAARAAVGRPERSAAPHRPEGVKEARGGLAVGLHPAMTADIQLLPSKRNSNKSKFATTIANQKSDSRDIVPKSKQLELLDGPNEDLTDREKNPYFDHKLGGRDTTKPADRRSRPMTFNQPGKFIERANKIRSEQSLIELRARIAATARRAGLEDDMGISGRVIAFIEPPEVEWWDQDYTRNSTYDDVETHQLKIDSHDSPITAMIQHPIPIPAPADISAPGPAAVMYTKRERKKIRKQEREARLKDKQDKQRLGLIPPEPPKVKLSNMATVLAQSTVQDPTKVERQVRAQVASRKRLHEKTNRERALTKEQKQEKAIEQLRADEALGVRASAWRIPSLANNYNRRRMDENAQQCGITGLVILNERMNMVYAEAGAKSIKFFKKLMENRIEWADDENPENVCTCIWEGEVKSRSFTAFRYHKCLDEVAVKDIIGTRTHVQSLWTIARNGKEDL